MLSPSKNRPLPSRFMIMYRVAASMVRPWLRDRMSAQEAMVEISMNT